MAPWVDRIESLSPASTARWGSMNVHQMICHLCDVLREPLGIRPTLDVSHVFSRSIMKWISFYLMPKWPEGKLPTSPEYDAGKQGTRPDTFEKDRDELVRLLHTFYSQPAWYRFHAHPFFGRLSAKEWRFLMAKHLDHHLRQFGV